MDYSELVKVLRGCVLSEPCEGCPYYDPDGPTEKCATINIAAADAIEELIPFKEQVEKGMGLLDKADELLKAVKTRWIPVIEGLPECEWGAEVGNIEWISCGMVHAGCFGRGGKYRDAYFRAWTDAGEGMDAKDADYWRAVTLPELPKEGTE